MIVAKRSTINICRNIFIYIKQSCHPTILTTLSVLISQIPCFYCSRLLTCLRQGQIYTSTSASIAVQFYCGWIGFLASRTLVHPISSHKSHQPFPVLTETSQMHHMVIPAVDYHPGKFPVFEHLMTNNALLVNPIWKIITRVPLFEFRRVCLLLWVRVVLPTVIGRASSIDLLKLLLHIRMLLLWFPPLLTDINNLILIILPSDNNDSSVCIGIHTAKTLDNKKEDNCNHNYD